MRNRRAIGFLFVVFVLPFLGVSSAEAAPVLIDKLAAVVGQKTVLLSEVREFRSLLRLRKEIDPFFSMYTLTEKSSDRDILDFLVDERLIGNEFTVSDQDVEQEIAMIEKNNSITREKLAEVLKAQHGASLDAYSRVLRVSLEKRNLIDRDIRGRVNVTDADVRNAYFAGQTKREDLELEFRISHILIAPISGKEDDARRRAQDALDEIRKGEPFDAVAKRWSEDTDTSSQGGDLGYISEAHLASELRDVVKRMSLGETSGVIATSRGLQILRLLDIRSSDESQLTKEKEAIRNRLVQAAFEEHIRLWLENRRQSVFLRVNP